MTDATPTGLDRPGPPHDLSSTRLLAFGWCLWLLGSWAVVLWSDSPVPATRWMVFAALIGLMAIWPLWRLSLTPVHVHRSRASPVGHDLGQTLLDWACLMVVLQAVVWPLRLTAGWSLMQTWWLDAALAVWSGLTGLVIAWSRGRTAAGGMALCLALLLGEPVVMLLSGGSWLLRVSPIQTVWALCAPPAQYTVEPWAGHVTCVAIAASGGWIALALWMWLGAARLSGPHR